MLRQQVLEGDEGAAGGATLRAWASSTNTVAE
jgi:hypothetical protein